MPGAHAAETAAVREFSRFYTRQIGLLEDGLHRSAFSLTEARILYELAHRHAPSASELGRDLALDPGYLSRILKRFEAGGLVRRIPHPGDARMSAIVLTEAGHAAFTPLDQASQEAVGKLIAPLSDRDRRDLVQAMTAIREALTGSGPDDPPFILRPLAIGDIGWIARRQGMLYAEEYGWDATFEALVAEIAAAFVRANDPRRERAWIAERRGEIAGSIFLVRTTDEVAKLRLLYVEPAARGLGIGGRLVAECLGFARQAGYRSVTLWTNDVLVSARRIYESAGFRLVAEDRHHSFGHDLVGQNWDLAL